MRRTRKAEEGVPEGSHVLISAPKAGEVVQHLVTASFDVLFEESDEPHDLRVNQGGKGEHDGNSKGVCGHLGCTTSAHACGLCTQHGGTAKGVTVCGHPDSTTVGANARGLCVNTLNSAGKRVCQHPGCPTSANARGLCGKHGGDARSVCENAGCTTKANARGLCAKHGGCTKAWCGHPGCTTKAHARSLCKKHGV
jgi:hypothetical protein